MFENIIDQGAAVQLCDDIKKNRCAPSMLFYGPAGSAKGSAALEFARVLSCGNQNDRGAWKCSCPSCERHRFLSHDDLLVLGKRSFACEIAACRSAFMRNPENQTARLLFYRSIRKLFIRFSAVVMEDDPDFSKIAPLLQSIDEKLNDFWTMNDGAEREKICAALVKDALSLENEGISSLIPADHVRSAASWCHLAPNGPHKILIIENAGDMRDEARNSLLKLLEEPPLSVRIILTAKRREALMPTILSRLRPYRFLLRSAEKEKEIIRRVFLDPEYVNSVSEEGSVISSYLDSFQKRNSGKLRSLAAWFIVSFARIISIDIKKSRGEIPSIINSLGMRYAQEAEESGCGRFFNNAEIIKVVTGALDTDESFARYMKILLELISDVTRKSEDPEHIFFAGVFGKMAAEAVTSKDALNINAQSALEGFLFKTGEEIKRGMNG
jgi:DNA polymerase-3 subunit gamma/tau